MSYSIFRVERVKGSGNTKGLQKHNQRENNNYNNKDIRHEDTHKNYDLINEENVDYNKLITDKIDANYTGNRKIRADAIRHVEGIITSDDKFFNVLSKEQIHQFFRDSLNFVEQEYGKENVLYATVHLDEKVPHMHFGFVPLTEDGRLSAKEKLGNKKAMTELQDRFNQYVNSRGYSLERGTAKQVSEREHKDIDKFKKDTEFHKQELKNVQKDLQKLNKQLNEDIERVKGTSEFEYDNEVEVTKSFFAGREERETGRKIVSAEEFMRLRDTISSAERIITDYQSIKNTDIYQRNEGLERSNLQLLNGNDRLQKKNRDLTKQLNEEKETRVKAEKLAKRYDDFATDLYKNLRKHIKGFEKMYDTVKEKFMQNDLTYKSGRFMEIIQDGVHFEDKKENERNKLKIRQRDDFEL